MCLAEGSERDVVCVAAGSGLGPIVSILRGLAAEARQGRRSVYVLYREWAVADTDIIRSLEPEFAGFTYCPSWSRGPGRSPEMSRESFFTNFLEEDVPCEPGEYEYYTAGPPELIKSIVSDLAYDYEVPVAQIHYDLF